jgi:hypothetical protein
VSALGHYLEEEGIATVAIASIRPQAENTRPPRALWVPFELGRPLAPPSDAGFQKRVLLAALKLLERSDGPVLLEDFPDDDPREQPDPAWQAPVSGQVSRQPGSPSGGVLADAMQAELLALAPFYAESCVARGRSTVGLSGLAPAACGDYVAAWLRGPPPAESPVADMSPVLCLRFAIDDLKAFVLEAAQRTGRPSAQQLGDWLWNETATGAAIRALRSQLTGSEDDRAKLIAGMFLVPGLRV